MADMKKILLKTCDRKNSRKKNEKQWRECHHIRYSRSGCNVIPILWSKIEYDPIFDKRDQLENILETIRMREHDGNKSQKITISEFGVGNTLRVFRFCRKNFSKIQQHTSSLIVKLVVDI